jgi:hypothetical protein
MARRNTTARQKAAAHAAAFTQREEKLQRLATDFFDLEDKSEHGKLQKRIQDYQQKLEELQANSVAAEAELRAQQAPIISAMKQTGETPANIAARLGVSIPVVRQALSEQKHQAQSQHETTHDPETVPSENPSSAIPEADREKSSYSTSE